MSLNAAHAPSSGGVVVYQGELILIYYNGIELALDSPDKALNGTKKGRLYLTTHRVIFVNHKLNDNLTSLSIPFHCLKDVDVEQPVFGSNYIKGRVVAEQGGGLPAAGGKFKIWFTHGGAIEYTESLMKAARLAAGYTSHLPTVFVRPDNSLVIMAPPPAYTPPTQYEFVSPIFTDRPPNNSVYQYESPPPYPGCLPPSAPPAPGAAPNGGNVGWRVEPPKLPNYDDAVKQKDA